jgi:hypothetical protein
MAHDLSDYQQDDRTIGRAAAMRHCVEARIACADVQYSAKGLRPCGYP